MTYKLFLDDLRFPETGDWIIARTMDDAVWYVENKGIPHFISFDHDLAADHYIIGDGEKTGYDFAKWFANHVMDNDLKLPDSFDYYVHSMNPVGKENIEKYMIHWLHNYRVPKIALGDF
jgi:hypothetical protein